MKHMASSSRIDWEHIYGRLDTIERVLEATTQMSTEREAEILAERALLLARESKTALDLTFSDRLLVIAFQVGDHRFAVEVKDIQEIVSLSQIVRVPCVPDFIAGITNVRGNIVTLVDVRRLFGDKSEGIVDLKRAILIANGESRLGLLSEEILGTMQFRRDSLQKMPHNRDADRFVRGLTDDLISLLDADAIISDPRVNIDDEA
jgi:purine-binding chemotaxis protein CheW